MTALSRAPQFGVFPTPEAAAYPQIVRAVQVAEQRGLDLVGIQDHPYQPRFLDTFALIADLLARTERLHVFPDVANFRYGRRRCSRSPPPRWMS